MDFFVRKLGSQISVDDVLRYKFDHISNFLERYKCDAGGMRHKVPRAECLAAYYNSRPDEVFVLPLATKVPLGTVFALRDADPRKASNQRFLRVTHQDDASGTLRLRVYKATLGTEGEKVKQTDDDILRNVGYEEVMMMPSEEDYWTNANAFIEMREDMPRWTLNYNNMARVQDIEVYNAHRKCTTHRHFRVSKSWTHPWLDRGEFIKTIETLRRTPGYSPETSAAAFETLRARFLESQPRVIAPLPRRNAMDSPELASILMDHMPPCTRAVLAQTTRQFHRSAKDMQQTQTRLLRRILSTRFSATKIFRLRCALLFMKASRDDRQNTASLMPFETGWTMRFQINHADHEQTYLIFFRKSEDLRHVLVSREGPHFMYNGLLQYEPAVVVEMHQLSLFISASVTFLRDVSLLDDLV